MTIVIVVLNSQVLHKFIHKSLSCSNTYYANARDMVDVTQYKQKVIHDNIVKYF